MKITLDFFILILCLCVGCTTSHSQKKIETEIKTASLKNNDKRNLVSKEIKPDYIVMAKNLVNLGHYSLAIVHLKDALKINGKNPELFYLLGKCNRKLGKFHEAEQRFHQALNLDNEYASAYNGLGITYRHLNYKHRQIDAFEKAVGFNPGRADFYNNLGYSYLEERNYEKAVDCFHKSLDLVPDFKFAINNLGICLGLSARYDEALATFLKSMPIDEALNNMGVIYEHKGDIDKAITMYNKALHENPNLMQAEVNLARIESYTAHNTNSHIEEKE